MFSVTEKAAMKIKDLMERQQGQSVVRLLLQPG